MILYNQECNENGFINLKNLFKNLKIFRKLNIKDLLKIRAENYEKVRFSESPPPLLTNAKKVTFKFISIFKKLKIKIIRKNCRSFETEEKKESRSISMNNLCKKTVFVDEIKR